MGDSSRVAYGPLSSKRRRNMEIQGHPTTCARVSCVSAQRFNLLVRLAEAGPSVASFNPPWPEPFGRWVNSALASWSGLACGKYST